MKRRTKEGKQQKKEENRRKKKKKKKKEEEGKRGKTKKDEEGALEQLRAALVEAKGWKERTRGCSGWPGRRRGRAPVATTLRTASATAQAPPR